MVLTYEYSLAARITTGTDWKTARLLNTDEEENSYVECEVGANVSEMNYNLIISEIPEE